MKFSQSNADFPMLVTLGEKNPFFGLNRFNKALRFVPLDEENFTLRGGKQRLLYKGKQRSHRFTILGDTAFEYDCILEKEPDSNVISLLMEGAENYDFFLQPDFVKDPFLKGSYAVYKKETLIGEGTGKLCHIHRPQIIDARGRRCWGSLAVIANMLRITIPEKWLGEAAYPIIVDPTVGTSIVGSQTKTDIWGDWETVLLGDSLATNRFLVPENMNGKATAYVYLYRVPYGNGNYENNNKTIVPCMYSDVKSKPVERLSANEKAVDDVVSASKPDGWRTATFSSNRIIASGSYIWFGVSSGDFTPRFDYGAKCYLCWHDNNGLEDMVPNIYPIDDEWGYFDNIKISMYFTSTAMQQYVRKITQSVTLTDKRKLKADYKRNAKQTVKVNSVLSRFETLYRKCAMTVHNSMKIKRYPSFIRTVADYIASATANSENRSLSRKCIESIAVNSETIRTLAIFHKILDSLNGIDNQAFSVLFVRSLPDTAIISDKNRHIGSFIRCPLAVSENTAETLHKAEYHRFNADRVQAKSSVLRNLFLYVRIITKVFVRDYILGRFLKARQDLVLKSAICRELTLDSKLS
jgi:hypothetical protein